MNLLFDHFEKLLDAPNSIKKMRELILQLAVQGKLVPQDSNDEPASELLKKIKAEKQKLIAEGKIKKQKPLPPIKPDEIPYELPKGWVWCRLGGITNYGSSDKIEPDKILINTWVLELEDIEKGTSKLIKRRTNQFRKSKSTKSVFYKNDVLYGKLRPYLDKVLIADYDGVCTTEILPLRGYRDLLPQYLRWFLKSPDFIEYANNSTHGMNLPRLGTEKGKVAIFALPPYQEQHRIVAKVGQLMALCDELDKLKERRDRKRMLMNRASLFALLNSQTPDEFSGHWQRIVNHFAEFYRTPENVAELKKAILQLAVQGKLVPQDSNDEPASELLQNIKAEKQKLIAEGKIKKDKPLPLIQPEEIPYELPKGWVWCRFGELIDLISGQHIVTSDYNNNGIGNPYLTGPSDFGIKHPHFTKYTTKPKVLAQKEDILITVKGSGIGKLNVLHENNVAIGRQLMAIRSKFISNEYVLLFLDGNYSILQSQKVGIAIPGIGRDDILEKKFPLPPLNEQRRIVAKVDELMGLCDELEKGLTQSRECLGKALKSVVNGVG